MRKILKIFVIILVSFFIVILGLIFYQTLNPTKDIINAEYFLNVRVKTDKYTYYIKEPVKIDIDGYLGKNEEHIKITHCRFSIYKITFNPEELDKIFDTDWCNRNQDFFIQFYNKIIINSTFIWYQEKCTPDSLNYVGLGNYSIKLACSYANIRGSSWEGVYHGSIYDEVNISIV